MHKATLPPGHIHLGGNAPAGHLAQTPVCTHVPATSRGLTPIPTFEITPISGDGVDEGPAPSPGHTESVRAGERVSGLLLQQYAKYFSLKE